MPVEPTVSVSPYMARRRGRHIARMWLWWESRLRRVRSCGRHAISDRGISLRVSGPPGQRRSGFAGLASCGSVWACPVCSAKVAGHRQHEVARALHLWHARGGTAALMTLTMRHRATQPLPMLWDALSFGWDRVTSRRQWTEDQDRYGTPITRTIATGARKGQQVTTTRVPTIRVVEATHGKNGWHLHIHALLLLRPGMTSADLTALSDRAFVRWRDALASQGLAEPSRLRGLEAEMIDGDSPAVAGYLTKALYDGPDDDYEPDEPLDPDEEAEWDHQRRAAAAESTAAEITQGHAKKATRGHRAPFDLLRDAIRHGDADDLDLWHQWETGSKGRRQLTWTYGLRQHLGMADEIDDQAVVDQDHDGHDLDLPLPPAVLAHLAGDRWRLQEAAEADDTGDTVRALLADLTAHVAAQPPRSAQDGL